MPGGFRVGRVAFVVLVSSFAGLVLVSGSGRASLYTPDDPRFVISVGPDGNAQALEYKEFGRRLATLLNAADNRKKTNGKENSDRLEILGRIEKAQTKKLSPIETTAFAADLLRAGRVDEALNRIKPVVDRSPNYFAYTTLAHVYSARGDWREAVENQLDAIDAKAPVGLKGLTKEQCDWIAKLDRDYVLPYYKMRLRESTAKPKHNPLNEDVYPFFPPPEHGKPHDPIRFVNDSGQYQPGVLAASERAKLPPDAIAIVQQLMLWFPTDTRIYWLLAELYAADGQFAPAREIMDNAVSEARQFGNRKLLVEHRAAVRAADDAQPRKPSADDVPLVQAAESQQPTPPAGKEPISMKTVLVYFGVVGLIAVFAFIRAMSRKAKGDCGPVG